MRKRVLAENTPVHLHLASLEGARELVEDRVVLFGRVDDDKHGEHPRIRHLSDPPLHHLRPFLVNLHARTCG